MSEEKTYILDCKDGQQKKLTIPAEWKITFGPLIPSERGQAGTLALRIYESKERQRAIFTDVKSFRDADIQILEKNVKIKQQRASRETRAGAKDVMLEARITEWTNPDEPEEPDEEFSGRLPWNGDDL